MAASSPNGPRTGHSWVEPLEASPHHHEYEAGASLVEILAEEREQVEREKRGDVLVVDDELLDEPEFRAHLERRAKRRERVLPFLRVRRPRS